MPVTALLLGLAAVAVSGLPPFGLFVSELTIIAGGVNSDYTLISAVILTALIFVFCGVLTKLAGLLLGERSSEQPRENISACNVAAMSLPLGMLLLFTAWLPASLRELIEHAANIIRGVP
jgi:hydrogenase-4 component F